MKKILLLLSFALLIGCSKEKTKANDYKCYDCVITQYYYSKGKLINIIKANEIKCATQSDYNNYLNTTNHSDTSLVQTCECKEQ